MPTSRNQPFSRSKRRRRLCVEALESRRLMAGLPFGALPQDTGEFMLGKVAVTPVFLESNGQFDPSTENWTPALIQSTLQTVQTGLDWWVDLLAAQQSVHTLEFSLDTTYATSPAASRYEPINRVSNDYTLWAQEFLVGVGFGTSGNLEADMRAFNHAQRLKLGTDWAFTMFVINSNNDSDGQFPSGGSFLRAFAFAGGLFMVSPSTRPASTFAHETGHMFWGKDEYAGGASYAERRGYYGTQNSNAADNPAPGFVQQPSIMATGSLLQTAYDNHVSPATTLAMVGWQDSDQDGIFDVLDVPLELRGTGHYDAAAGAYKFVGSANVGVLPNLNTDGLRNDITLNRISSVQYRIDGGAWTTVAQPDSYEAALNLSIPATQPGQIIEIRAVDAATGISSNVFQGRFQRADAVANPGINGFVWIDSNKNGLRDVGEFGEASWQVEVLSSAGEPLALRRTVEPDNLPVGALTASSVQGANITAIGADADGRAGVFADTVTSTGTRSFRAFSRSAQSWLSNWNSTSRKLQVDFATATSIVEIDAVGASSDSYGRLEAYDAAGKLIDRFTTTKLANGQVAKMRVESAAGSIAYVLSSGHANSSVRLDNLRFGPETVVTTQDKGQFSVPHLPAGSYRVKVTPTSNSYSATTLGGSQRAATLVSGGTTKDIDFAFQSNTSNFQNPVNRFDVNASQSVSPLDVLLIINDINQHGPRDLAAAGYQPPPYIDVSGDGFCSALDALLVINLINSGAAAGESYNAPWDSVGGIAAAVPEGDDEGAFSTAASEPAAARVADEIVDAAGEDADASVIASAQVAGFAEHKLADDATAALLTAYDAPHRAVSRTVSRAISARDEALLAVSYELLPSFDAGVFSAWASSPAASLASSFSAERASHVGLDRDFFTVDSLADELRKAASLVAYRQV